MTQSKIFTGIKRASLIVITLSLVLIAALIPQNTIKAQSSPKVSISPSSQGIDIGDTTNIDVYVKSGVDINAFDITISYDPALVSVESYAPGEYLSNLALVYKKAESGKLQLVYTQLATAGVTGNGTILILSFKGLAVGSSAINIDSITFSSSASNLITPSVQNGTINVAKGTPKTATFTVTPTPTHTSTSTPTRTPTMTPTMTLTNVPTRTVQATPTRTSTIVVTNTPHTNPTSIFPATSTSVEGTLLPTSTSSALLTLTAQALPIPITGKDITPSSSETSGGFIVISPTPTQSVPGKANLGFFNQLLCVISILLLFILIVLMTLILKRKKKK